MTKKRKNLDEKIGYLIGKVDAMDERMTRMEQKQDSHLKQTSKHAVVFAGVLGVVTNIVIEKIKTSGLI